MLQDLLLDNPRHGVCFPAPLTTTSRLQERASSLRPPLPEVGRAPGAEPLSPLALTRRPAPSWPQHRSVTGARRGGTGPVPRPPPQRRPRAGGAGQDGAGAGADSPAHVVPWARAVPPPPFACSQSPCPPARHLRPQSAPKGPARLTPSLAFSPPASASCSFHPSLAFPSPRLWKRVCASPPVEHVPTPSHLCLGLTSAKPKDRTAAASPTPT